QSPREQASFNYTSPLRALGGEMPSSTYDPRTTLQRRFTTNAVPTISLSAIGQQRRQAAESTDLSSATYHKVQLLEKKKKEYEALKEQRLRFQTQMELLDLQSKREEEELQKLHSDLSTFAGHQSEPTTPPEYREAGFPTSLSRPNRYSSASLASPPNGQTSFSNRTSRSGSQAMAAGFQSSSHNPSKSVPGSRRNSDEEEDEYEFDLQAPMPRTGANPNRISLPMAASDLRALGEDNYSVHDPHNIAASLLDDDDKASLEMGYTQDKFPTLVRRPTGAQQPDPSVLAAASQQQSPDLEKQSTGWPPFNRHRQGQQSLPMNSLRNSTHADDLESHATGILDTPTKTAAKTRYSMEVKANPFFENKRSSLIASPPNGLAGGPPKLTSSYSTNDIPTVKGTNGMTTPTATNTHAEQHLHNHNASIGRIPASVANRHSRELSGDVRNDEAKAFRPMQSALHANAAPFGPTPTTLSTGMAPITLTSTSNNAYAAASPNSNTTAGATYYGGYGLPMANNLTLGMHNLNIGNPQPQWNNQQMQAYQTPFDSYKAAIDQFKYGQARFTDSQARVIQQRRLQQSEGKSLSIFLMHGQVYQYCKDQHGCRFLQKKLEENKPEQTQLIFNETKDYVVELMQDPFGNYLCQKLLEFATVEQRTELIINASSQMIRIALNQHGTRALQKMIEFISTPEQIETIIAAIGDEVVSLIQDLNGNHVIQKCLNHLSPQEAQFIFDAVGVHCVVVGTHRHGCCVLQRCIDHASGPQRAQLVRQITANAFALVQDPFGNYVVQYILDLGEPGFSTPLCLGFRGNIGTLSKQKFSSNVIEKCIRVADRDTRRIMIEEIMSPGELSRMTNDSFANYVVQTAIEHADVETKTRLMDELKAIVPQIRNTPHGRRFMQKIQEYDSTITA
ncbi:ARM repeat-containing protein, partial [Rhizodiscina lignyota]